MRSYYDIKIGDSERVVSVAEAASREITISGKSYVVPTGLVAFIGELAEEIKRQQDRKIATDKQLDNRINQRVDRMLKALDQNGMLAKHLHEKCVLPSNVETSGGWTFLDEARIICKDGLKNEYGVDLVEDIGSQFGKSGR